MIKNCAALTIAGSDSGGGAGIQADLKTFSAFGVFGTSVLTAVTAQNLSGVYAIQAIEPDVVRSQLTAVLSGFPIKAIKTGMLFSSENIAIIADTLSAPEYAQIPVVIDPVFISTSGSKLIRDEAVDLMISKLFPRATLITPNIPEAETLLGIRIQTGEDLEEAADLFYKRFGVPVLVKGGHLSDRAIDVLVYSKGIKSFESKLIAGVNTHGTGCTLSSAIAASLATGKDLWTAVQGAKIYITDSLTFPVELSPDLRVLGHFS
ncbi:MAG: bifunctional hydroxymethylpyrimidine kinase/phosphomethylpyrimidine kinase [Candidatus Omnitrophota bacterium]